MALAIAVTACSNDDEAPIGLQDGLPPTVTIVQPAEGSQVNTARPLFVVRASDAGSGVAGGSINAVINPPGTNVTEFFSNGVRQIDDETIEVRVAGQILLDDGSRTLVFTISDEQGNEATARSTFLVNTISTQ